MIKEGKNIITGYSFLTVIKNRILLLMNKFIEDKLSSKAKTNMNTGAKKYLRCSFPN